MNNIQELWWFIISYELIFKPFYNNLKEGSGWYLITKDSYLSVGTPGE